MVAIVDGHVLTAHTGGVGAVNSIKHYDADAVLLETITLPAASIGSGNDLYVKEIRQRGAFVYVAVTDLLSDFDGIIELDTDLSYVRTVVRMDRSDPNQTPGVDPIGEFDIRASDGAYVIVSDDDDHGPYAWEYTAGGAFVARHTVPVPSGASATQQGIMCNPSGDGFEIIRFAVDTVAPKRAIINRFNLDTDSDTGDVEESSANTILFGPGSFLADGTAYLVLTDRGPTPDTDTMYVYDNTWTLIDSATVFAMPVGYTRPGGELRLTSDGLYAWRYVIKADHTAAIVKVRLSDNTIVAGPTDFTPASGTDDEVFVCGDLTAIAGGFVFGAVIG